VVANAIELSRIAYRKRAQQNAVHQREDGCVGANAQRQRNHHRQRKPGRLAQLPQCVANVLNQRTHRPVPPWGNSCILDYSFSKLAWVQWKRRAPLE
jgi:hypothetical protein